MLSVDNQAAYWSRVAPEKTFRLPLDLDRFGAAVAKDARVLDYGCGYGRNCAALVEAGFTNVIGVDSSRGMIERGRKEFPHLDLVHLEGDDPPFADGSFDAVLLFAVLTSTIGDQDQVRLIDRVARLLRPGGVLHLGDFWLQTDRRNLERYREFQNRYGVYGVFELPDGGVMRHHDREWIASLLNNFETIHQADIRVVTMNGHDSLGFQFLGRKKVPSLLTAKP